MVVVKKQKLSKPVFSKIKKKELRKRLTRKENDHEEIGLDNQETMEAEEESADEIASEDGNVGEAAGSEKAGVKHLRNLQKLKESDPEFYKFLQEQDADLLEFHASDEEDEEVDGEKEYDEGDEEERKEGVSKLVSSRIPKAKKDSSGRMIFDGRMLDYLHSTLDPEHPSKQRIQLEDIRFAVEAFSACVSRVGADMDMPKYIINEQKVFYDTVRLCFEKLGHALTALVTGSAEVKDELEAPEASNLKLKLLRKYQSPVKQYLSSLLKMEAKVTTRRMAIGQHGKGLLRERCRLVSNKFANEVQTPDVIISTLRAIRHITDLFAHFKKITKGLIKVLVRIWSRKTLDCRVGAYVCIVQLVRSHPEHFISLYKSCYLGFVANSRDVSSESWPLLHFMHRTFAELTVLHPDLAYQYVFVYIRQIAIHLRNAIISKKRKDMVQTVYNWQMMQCLYLWTRVVSKAHTVHDCEAICELTYPLAQLINGVLKLYHSLRYIPLRLHCIALLIQLQANCGVFVPTLAHAVELLDDAERILAKKPKAVKNAKAVDMECSLKVAVQVLEDNVWRSALCDQLFRVALQAAHLICSQPSFPDVIVPITFRIRDFLRKIRSVEFSRCFRSLLEKLEEQAKFIANVLLVKEFDVKEETEVMSLRLALNNPDSPLRVFYRQWEKAWRLKQRMLTKTTAKEAKKEDSKQKKPVKKAKKADRESKAAEKPRKKKRKSDPVADKADDTIPDQLEELGNWSDSN